MIIVHKNGESKVIKQRYLNRHLDDGWSLEPPKSKALQKLRGSITRAVPEVIQPPVQEEPEALPQLKETEDGNL
jgi:hypothetical protein